MAFFKHFQAKKRIYLDYASSTPRDARMIRRISTIDTKVLAANPSALHKEGVALKKLLADARSRVAKVLEIHSNEVIFTASATESDNLALLGTINHFIESGIAPEYIAVCSSDLEHAAISETIASAVVRGVAHVPIAAPGGIIDPKSIVLPDNAKVAIVTVMYINNEIGTVQPIADIAKRIRHLRKLNPEVKFIFHTDATQAPLHFSLRVPSLGVDMMTLGATKLYCGKGVGVLYKKRSIKLSPIMYGGGQEFGVRPGTEPVALIHECSYALEYAQIHREAQTARIKSLQEYFETKLKKIIPQAIVTAQDKSRTPHISHVVIHGFDSELLVLELDARNIAVSAKSACKNEERNESLIVESIHGIGYGAVRFSFGRMTSKKEIYKAVKALQSVFKKYQK